MKLSQHFIISTIAAFVSYPFLGISSVFVFIGGFLVDVDHVLDYYIRYRKLDLGATYEHYMRENVTPNLNEYKAALRVFHTVEFIGVIAILSFFNEAFLALFIGLILHFIMDIRNEMKLFKELHNYSLIKRLVKQKAL